MSDASHKSVPEWAIDRVQVLSAPFSDDPDFEINERFPTVRAFARYIAEHEEAPVDPLEAALSKANEILKGQGVGTYDEALGALADILTAHELAGDQK